MSQTADIPSELPRQIETTMVTYMNRQIFRAAQHGDIEPFDKYEDPLDQLVDADQNTALHIYSSTGGNSRSKNNNNLYLHRLLDKCHSLLLQANASGEVPLHVAASHGHLDIVLFLIQRSKEQHGGDLEQMLRMRDNEQNTALHKAAQYGRLNVVRVLLKEDPDLSSSNTSGETPLYVAARGNHSQHHNLVAEILDANCNPMAIVGPGGRTILHAATLAQNKQTVRIILERKKHLTKERDGDGRTPLHYAALHCADSLFDPMFYVAKDLLKCDATAAYITDESGMSPLHLAAWRGNAGTMELIMKYCPGCLGIVDKRGRNFLHFAAVPLPRFLQNLRYRNLLEKRDVNGITPFHVFLHGPAPTRSNHTRLSYLLVLSYLKRRGFWAQIPIWDEYSQDSEIKKKVKEALTEIGSLQVVGMPAHKYFRESMKEGEDSVADPDGLMKEVKENNLVVATLVATVSFAAAVTVPGGYKGDQGTAILGHNLAFQAFVISDALAFVSSLSAVLSHFFMIYFFDHLQFLAIGRVDLLTFFSTVMMGIAFSTALFAVLESSLSLAIGACVIANTCLLIVACLFFPVFRIAIDTYEFFIRM